MGQLIHELNWTLDRILYIAPNGKRLRQGMMELAEDLVADFGSGQELDLKTAQFQDSGALETLLSFHLGKRSGLWVRLQIWGLNLEQHKPSDALLNSADAIVLNWVPGLEGEEKLFHKGLLRKLEDTPSLAIVPPKAFSDETLPPEHKLRSRAQWALLEEKGQFFHICEGHRNFLRSGLEWALSF